MKKSFRAFISLIIIIFFCFSAGPMAFSVHALDNKKQHDSGKVVIVIVDRITWDDFLNADIPVMKALALQGSVGLMTTNPAGGLPRIPDNTYATIGTGAKAAGGPSAGAAYNIYEPYESDSAGESFFRRTGIKPGQGQVIHLGVAEMDKANRELKNQFAPGAIGNVLHRNGLKTAVIGNADLPIIKKREGKFRRHAALIAMDSSGLVDYGSVSPELLAADPKSPGGVKTDYDKVLALFRDLRDKADLVVLETGDTSRVDESRHIMLEEAADTARQKALVAVDTFIGELLREIDLNRDRIMVVVPAPPGDAMNKGRFLTPYITAGRGVAKGVVWSGTTKRGGLIANIDIAPTVTGFFGIPPVTGGGEEKTLFVGREIRNQPAENPFIKATDLYEDTAFLYNSRYPLVKTFINTQFALVILAVLLLVSGKKSVGRLVPFLLAYTVVPGVLLWGNFIPRPSISFMALAAVGLTVVLTVLARIMGRRDPLDPFMIIAGLTVIMVAADIFLGAPLAKTSPFSYDAMTGARFYGIGNEYMGVLIGAGIVFTGLVFDRLRPEAKINTVKALALVVFGIITYSIAAPHLGTNVGGTIAAMAGFGAAALIMAGVAVSKRSLAAVLVVTALVLAGFIAFDLTRAVEAQSHIGRTFTMIRNNGFEEIGNIINRKWQMNFKLIVTTTWSWFYFSCLLIILLAIRLFPAEVKRFREKYPWLHRFLPAVLTGSIFALIFNDSGVVAAAMMITYAIAPFLAGIIWFKQFEGK